MSPLDTPPEHRGQVSGWAELVAAAVLLGCLLVLAVTAPGASPVGGR